MKAIGYARVSTDEQTQQGVSLSHQDQKIRAYCVAKDWELHSFVRDESYSGKDLNRPGIQEITKPILFKYVPATNADIEAANKKKEYEE
jgi:DNA invertase Pin-like site-specific DNA recombinase